jgi:hypothetical protein
LEEEHWSSIVGAGLHYACFHRQKEHKWRKNHRLPQQSKPTMEIVITMPTGNVYQYFRVEEKKNQNQVSNDCTEFRTFSNQEDWTQDLRSCRDNSH